MAKRIEPRYECIAYLSVEADLNVVDRLEDKQLKYIKEYAKAHKEKSSRCDCSRYEICEF